MNVTFHLDLDEMLQDLDEMSQDLDEMSQDLDEMSHSSRSCLTKYPLRVSSMP